MKKIYIALAVCAATAFISCEKAEKGVSETKTHPMSITLNREDADTKTTITTDGTSLKRVWKEGDAVAVIYGDKIEKFTLSGGAGTTSGTFTCPTSEIPTSGEQYVAVLYPYTDTKASFGWIVEDISTQTGKLEDLGNYDILVKGPGTNKAKFVDGIWNTEGVHGYPMSSISVFFRIPAGTKIFNTSDPAQTNTVSFTFEDNMGANLYNQYWIHPSDFSGNDSVGAIDVSSASLTGGCLDEDVYIAAYMDSSWDSPEIKIAFHCVENGKPYQYTISKTGYIYRSRLYTIGASHFTPTLGY